MVRIKATYTIHRRDDPTGERVVKIATWFKNNGARVKLERLKTKYRIEIDEVASLDSVMKVFEKDDRETDKVDSGERWDDPY